VQAIEPSKAKAAFQHQLISPWSPVHRCDRQNILMVEKLDPRIRNPAFIEEKTLVRKTTVACFART